MLEKMGEFFNSRLDGYEEHQLTTIDSAQAGILLRESSFSQSYGN